MANVYLYLLDTSTVGAAFPEKFRALGNIEQQDSCALVLLQITMGIKIPNRRPFFGASKPMFMFCLFPPVADRIGGKLRLVLFD